MTVKKLEQEQEQEEDLASKLRTDIRRSEKALKPYRKHRLDAIEFYLGSYYAEDKEKKGVLSIALLNLMVDTYTRSLVSGNPRALVTTRKRQWRPDAATLGLAVDEDIVRMDLQGTIRDAVKDAMFSVGIVCTYVVASADVEIDNEAYEVGDCVASRVSLDDFIFDADARRFSDCYYMGHKIRVPLDWAKANRSFDKDVREKLRATENFQKHPEDGGERAESLGKSSSGNKTEHVIPQVDLWVLWLRRSNEIVIFAVEGGGEILSKKKWKGPKSSTGPYRMLGFETVPDNIMPLPPIANLRDLAEVANDLLYKITEQARRQKTVLAATRNSAKDAKKLQDGEDGDIILVDHTLAGNVAEFKTGGVDQPTLGTFLAIRDLFSWIAGNLEAQAGLGPQSDTVGQDKIITRNATGRVRAMAQDVERFTKDVMSDIAWHRWNDPIGEVFVLKRVAGTDIEVPATFSSETREGDLEDYDINLVPYSLQALSPTERAAQLRAMWQQDILPAVQLAGGAVVPKIAEYIRLMAKYSGLPEDVDAIVDIGAEPDSLPSGKADRPMKPPVTHRNYTRTNRSAATTVGKDRVILEAAMGGNPQPKERAALGRPVGA